MSQHEIAVRSNQRQKKDFDFELIDMETQSKHSTAELVKGLNPDTTTNSWTASVHSK